MFRVTKYEETFKKRIWLEDERGNELFVKIYEDYADKFSSIDLLILRNLARTIINLIGDQQDDYVFATTSQDKYSVIYNGVELILSRDYSYIAISGDHNQLKKIINIDNKYDYYTIYLPINGAPQLKYYDEYDFELDEREGILITDEKILQKLKDVILFKREIYEREQEFYSEYVEIFYIEYNNKKYLIDFTSDVEEFDMLIDIIKSYSFEPNELLEELELIKEHEKELGRVSVFKYFDKISFGKLELIVDGVIWRSIYNIPLIKNITHYSNLIVIAEGNNSNFTIYVKEKNKTIAKLIFSESELRKVNISRDGVKYFGQYFKIPDVKNTKYDYYIIIDFENSISMTKYFVKVGDYEDEIISATSPDELNELLKIYDKLTELGFTILSENVLIYDSKKDFVDSYIRVDLGSYRVSVKFVNVDEINDKDVYNELIDIARKVSNILGVPYEIVEPKQFII